jgi:hypothetical protein
MCLGGLQVQQGGGSGQQLSVFLDCQPACWWRLAKGRGRLGARPWNNRPQGVALAEAGCNVSGKAASKAGKEAAGSNNELKLVSRCVWAVSLRAGGGLRPAFKAREV